jgi:hypothetical protein
MKKNTFTLSIGESFALAFIFFTAVASVIYSIPAFIL